VPGAVSEAGIHRAVISQISGPGELLV